MTGPTPAPTPPTATVSMSKDELQAMLNEAAEQAARKVKRSPAKGSEEEARELERSNNRLDDLFARLIDRIKDDPEKLRTAIDDLENLMKELKIKLPPKRPTKKAADTPAPAKDEDKKQSPVARLKAHTRFAGKGTPSS